MHYHYAIVREIDAQGRIVLPRELLRRLHIEVEDPIGIDVDDKGRILLAPLTDRCTCCGEQAGDLKLYNDMALCAECRDGFGG